MAKWLSRSILGKKAWGFASWSRPVIEKLEKSICPLKFEAKINRVMWPDREEGPELHCLGLLSLALFNDPAVLREYVNTLHR